MSDSNSATCLVAHDWAIEPSQCLYEWQGLEAGGVAILAAVIGYFAVHKQTKHAEKLENRRLERVFQARRSTLPLILSEATQFAEQVILSLGNARAILSQQGNAGLTGNWSPPVFPEDIPLELRNFLEISGKANANALISELLRQLQTLRSRLFSLVAGDASRRIGLSRELAEYQLQASKVRQLCGALFPFGRGETDEVPTQLCRDEVVNSINFVDHAAELDPAFAERAQTFLRARDIWWPRAE